MTGSPEIEMIVGLLGEVPDDGAIEIIVSLLTTMEDAPLGELVEHFSHAASPVLKERLSLLKKLSDSRRRNCRIAEALQADAVPLENITELLADLHMVWFDKDDENELRTDMAEFFAAANAGSWDSLEDAELFLRRCCILPEKETTIRPELYNIGAIIENRCGAGSILALLISAMFTAGCCRIVRVNGTFAVADDNGNILLMDHSLHQIKAGSGEFEVWSVRRILNYIMLTMFSCAVNSDSYRYIMITALILLAGEPADIFRAFPHPYRGTAANENF